MRREYTALDSVLNPGERRLSMAVDKTYEIEAETK